MYRALLFFFVVAALPFTAYATVGFAQESVWVSKTPVYEGEEVRIYAALTNGDNLPLKGTAHFRDNGSLVGSATVSLEPGEAHIFSVAWKPTAGNHSLAVEIASTTVPLSVRTETKKVSVEKEKPMADLLVQSGTASAAEGYTDSSGIQAVLESVSPTIAGITAPALEQTDSWRQTGSEFLDGQIVKTQATIAETKAKRDELKADPSAQSEKQSRMLSIKQVLYTALIYIYEGFRTLVSKAGIFYPFILLVFFFLLWKLYQKMTGGGYRY